MCYPEWVATVFLEFLNHIFGSLFKILANKQKFSVVAWRVGAEVLRGMSADMEFLSS